MKSHEYRFSLWWVVVSCDSCEARCCSVWKQHDLPNTFFFQTPGSRAKVRPVISTSHYASLYTAYLHTLLIINWYVCVFCMCLWVCMSRVGAFAHRFLRLQAACGFLLCDINSPALFMDSTDTHNHHNTQLAIVYSWWNQRNYKAVPKQSRTAKENKTPSRRAYKHLPVRIPKVLQIGTL